VEEIVKQNVRISFSFFFPKEVIHSFSEKQEMNDYKVTEIVQVQTQCGKLRILLE